MPVPNPAALDFLLNRRSRPAKTLIDPAPDRAALMPILTAALRSPDHGGLEPWRLIVVERAALDRLSRLAGERAAALGLEEERAAKGISQFAQSRLCVAVVASPRPDPKVPEIEQVLSSGAVCLSLLNAALASGWGASWLTGWPAFDRPFVEGGLGLAPEEFIAGFVHLGTEGRVPPERPRPDLARAVSWVAE